MKRKDFLRISGAALASTFLPATAPAVLGKASSRRGEGPTRVDVKAYELELRHAWTLSRGTWNTRRNVFVRLERDGTTGFGEAAPIVRYNETAESASAFIAKAIPVLQKDLWEFQDRWREIDSLAQGEHAAKAALDMAILDWTGKSLGVQLFRLLGLSRDKTLRTSYSIGIDDIPVMQDKVREAADFSVLKIKVGGKDDRKTIEGIRAVTAKPLLTDANEGWKSREEALEMINWMAGMGVVLVEQPLPSDRLEDYLWLKERVRIPVFADESLMSAADIPRIAPAFHGINIKLMKCGGLQEAQRMMSLARTLGLKIMLGCMVESSLGITAGAILTPLVDYADLDGNLLITNDPFQGVRTVKDRLVLPDGPGLGVGGDVWS